MSFEENEKEIEGTQIKNPEEPSQTEQTGQCCFRV